MTTGQSIPNMAKSIAAVMLSPELFDAILDIKVVVMKMFE